MAVRILTIITFKPRVKTFFVVLPLTVLRRWFVCFSFLLGFVAYSLGPFSVVCLMSCLVS